MDERELEDVIVKAIAFTAKPATKQPFVILKSQEPEMGDQQADSFERAPEKVVKAVQSIKLAKGENAEASNDLECAAHFIHQNASNLTLQDLMAMGQAAGLEDVAKAEDAPPSSKKKGKGVAADEEDPSDEAEEDEEDEEEDKPFPPRKKAAKSASASAGASAEPLAGKEGASMADAADSKEEMISKSEFHQMREQLAKAADELATMRHEKAVALCKSEMEASYPNLEMDHEATAETILALRKSDKASADRFEASLKSADAQVRLAKAGREQFFRPKTSANSSPAQRAGMKRFGELVQERMEKSEGLSRGKAIQEVLKSSEGRAAQVALEGGR